MRKLFFVLSTVLMLLGPCFVSAQVAIPALAGHVVDPTGTLTVEQKTSLEQTLSAFEARKGCQLAVLMVASTQPESMAQYALRVTALWKLGRPKTDNGAILIIAKNDRTLRIEVGHSLEGVMSDFVRHRIINEVIVPRLEQHNYDDGIEAGVARIIRTIDGEPLPEPVNGPKNSYEDILQVVPFLFILTLAVGGVLRNALGKVLGSVMTGGVVALFAWFAMRLVLASLFAGVAALLITLMWGGMVKYGFGGYGYSGRDDGHGGRMVRGDGGEFGGGGASGRW